MLKSKLQFTLVDVGHGARLLQPFMLCITLVSRQDRQLARHAQTAGYLGFAVQFNAETLWHFAQLPYPQVG